MKRHAAMNRIYRLVWSQVSNAWVAVAENAKGRGKAISGRKLIAAALALAGSGLLAPLALAAPTAGKSARARAALPKQAPIPPSPKAVRISPSTGRISASPPTKRCVSTSLTLLPSR